MHPDHLVELIRRHSARSRENLQVADRLRSLLPQVLSSLKPGEALVKIVHDELVRVMGEENEDSPANHLIY